MVYITYKKESNHEKQMCFDLLFCVSFLFYEKHNKHNAALPLQSRRRFHKSLLHFDLANIEHILTKIQSKITFKQPFKKKLDIILYCFLNYHLPFFLLLGWLTLWFDLHLLAKPCTKSRIQCLVWVLLYTRKVKTRKADAHAVICVILKTNVCMWF